MLRSWAKQASRRLVWWAAAALCLAAPKCLLCVAGYVGIAAALGLGSPALCGAPHDGRVTPAVIATIAGIAVMFATVRHWRSRRRRTAPPRQLPV